MSRCTHDWIEEASPVYCLKCGQEKPATPAGDVATPEQFPDLRVLRKAYAAAIAASHTAEEALRTAVVAPQEQWVSADKPTLLKEMLHRGAEEREAGRAFMVALSEADPACRVCGCTAEDACWDDETGPCSWVEDDLCSACVGKEAAS